MSDNRFDDGMRMRRQVLGHAYVDQAEAGTTPFNEDFQRYITENAWGSVWTRPALEPATRSLLTIVLLAARGHWEELALHVQATRNTGASREAVREALFHVAVYAGVPAANHAFKIAARVFAESDGVASEHDSD